MRIADGRTAFVQWDTGQQIVFDAPCAEAHFAPRAGTVTIDVETRLEGGEYVADVPDELLQTARPVTVYAYVQDAARYTRRIRSFEVRARPKPADYIYTPTERETWKQLQAQIGNLGDLETEAKDSLVAAINEAAKSGGGSGGKDGTGIESITYKGEDESGGNMYTVLLTDGTSYDITAPKGAAGADGVTPHIGDNGNWYLGTTDIGKPSRGEKGEDAATDLALGLTGATVGQIAKISAVNENGVPTAWEPVDMPQGGGEREWIKIGEVTTTEDTTETTSIKFTKDVNGNSLSLKGVLVIGRALFSDANKHHCALICNDNPYGGNANYLLYEQCLRNAQTFTIYSEFLRADGVNSVAFTAFNSGNVKQNGGCASTINTWSPTYTEHVQFPMRGVKLTIPDSGLLAGSKFEFWGVRT